MKGLDLRISTQQDASAFEGSLLLWMYKRWRSPSGQMLRRRLETCDPQYDTPTARAELEQTAYLEIIDDAARCNIDIASERTFSDHFTQEPDIAERLTKLLGDRAKGQDEEIAAFVQDLRSLQGAKDGKGVRYGLRDSRSPRASLLWACALFLVANESLFPSDKTTPAAIVADLERMVRRYLVGSGYEPIDLDNVLDAYIAYSTILGIQRLQRSRKG